MKNRMQDLDFEQTVAFDSVKDFEFTRKAAQRFRQVVSLDGFEDEDADVIFHYLYKLPDFLRSRCCDPVFLT